MTSLTSSRLARLKDDGVSLLISGEDEGEDEGVDEGFGGDMPSSSSKGMTDAKTRECKYRRMEEASLKYMTRHSHW